LGSQSATDLKNALNKNKVEVNPYLDKLIKRNEAG